MYIPLRKPFIFTSVLLLFAGLLLSVALNFSGDGNYTLLMGIVATLIATGMCTAVNLLYFVNSASLAQRLLAPGVLVSVLFGVLYKDSLFDLFFFLFFGLINFGIGLYWYVSIQRMRRENDSNS